MNKKIVALFVLLFFANFSDAAGFTEKKMVLKTATGKLAATLCLPVQKKNIPIVLIISGSGPTDRNGNSPFSKNNSLQLLAHGMAQCGIASLRYDKRGIAESASAMKTEADLRFDDLVDDAKSWIRLLKKNKNYSQIVVLGHSEGSLIGMLAASDADKFISLAGAGRSADVLLKEQLKDQPEEIKSKVYAYLDTLKAGKTCENVPQNLYALFRPGVQPYMISWMKHDPAKVISGLRIPVQIVQGDQDIQVDVKDAQLLASSSAGSELVVIRKMNHVLRIIEGDRQANMASYFNGELPLSEELLNSICAFIVKK